jgi:hypothetical protein
MSEYRAPVVAQPGQPSPVPPVNVPLYVSFTAGRRGAGSIDCQTCGIPLHVHDDGPWHDGNGATRSHDRDPHTHTPAHEIGPTFGPFTYIQLTYRMLQVDDGEVLASWDDSRGDWLLEAAAGELAGQAYSDAITFPAQPANNQPRCLTELEHIHTEPARQVEEWRAQSTKSERHIGELTEQIERLEAILADQGSGAANQHHWKRTATGLLRERRELREQVEQLRTLDRAARAYRRAMFAPGQVAETTVATRQALWTALGPDPEEAQHA